ncbi:reverse transcriptase (RNA-dependent DNA polymerase) [Hirsutella rhossiliensis]
MQNPQTRQNWEWHNATRSKASEPSIFTRLAQRIRCDEEDYNECAHPNCKVHEHEKARAWHKRHNGAPKDYWRHLRRLQATFDQGKINAEELRAKQKDAERKLDSWYENEQNCEARYAINCEAAQCKQHSVEKQEIFDWLQEISLLSPDTTPRDENIKKRYQQQIEEEYPNETNKDQAKNEIQGPYAWQRQAMATKWASMVTGEQPTDQLENWPAALERRRKFQDQQIWEKAKFCDDLATEQDERDDRSSKSLRASAIQTKTATEPADTTKSTDKTHVLTNTAVQPGIRHKQNKGHNKKIRRVIATLRKTSNKSTKSSSQGNQLSKKEQSPQDRMKNIPQEYRKYDKLFKEELETGLPEHSQWDHEICLKDGRTPTFHKIYNLNEKQLQTLRDYLDENLRKGYIRTSTSEAGYPVIRLNDITMKDRTPLPLISELRDRLHGKKWFTALDLKGAYNLIRMKKGHEWMTAFRTKFGLFEYLVMPFGLTNAPATFQRMINNVLREHLDIFVVVYLDDILIFSDTLEEHKEHVHKVLRALQNAKLLVEPEKSKFHTQEVDFLGHTISPGEIRMQRDMMRFCVSLRTLERWARHQASRTPAAARTAM